MWEAVPDSDLSFTREESGRGEAELQAQASLATGG